MHSLRHRMVINFDGHNWLIRRVSVHRVQQSYVSTCSHKSHSSFYTYSIFRHCKKLIDFCVSLIFRRLSFRADIVMWIFCTHFCLCSNPNLVSAVKTREKLYKKPATRKQRCVENIRLIALHYRSIRSDIRGSIILLQSLKCWNVGVRVLYLASAKAVLVALHFLPKT